ncbi:thiamine diphosphokinase [Clostridium sp. 1001271B_151109_B4]|uniref:thiamine diphosphokinase n=1 Tax=Clostridium sp. 1001271B_151109_B4 TaxID=2787148 RepID=UPI0018AAEB46|nr:thiamine diphosphokinase [Clostridium sp. 1001271B_151109_B4]
MKCLIMSGGVKPEDKIIMKYANSCDLIIGVDKGCNYLYNLDIKPDYIVGDFDSSNTEVIEELEKRGSIKYKYKCEKDFTDSEEAFEVAISSGVTEIYFLGATGQRFDHTLGNLGLLLKALKSNVRAEIIDDMNKMLLVNTNTNIKNEKEYKYISFLAYNETIKEFSINKAKYELNKYNLEVGDSRTVSNEFVSEEIGIELSNGNILIIFSRD